MIVSYIYNILKYKKWRLLLYILIVIFGLKLFEIVTFRADVNQLLELHKCPVCYGVSACNYTQKIDITPRNFISALFYFLGVKNVFFGFLNKDQIVVKKLAHSSELKRFDLMLCENQNYSWLCADNRKENDKHDILSVDEGWPVPKYFGACGRIIIEEYVGLPLTEFYYKPWLTRAEIASSLLNAAYMFTFKSNNFGFYLTDISSDNIAVDSHNIARFVDLENVIVVDKNPIPEERSAMWDQLQENREVSNCTDCLIFSPSDICDHKISDHNYYAICQLLKLNETGGLISGGLLHDIPEKIIQLHPNIQYLIEQCSVPEVLRSRVSTGVELKELLDTIIKEQRSSIS